VDGYTVEEAASVLGVPRERVWELLARGIIAGSTDLGGAMRVRLKAEPAAAQSPAAVERPVEAAAHGPAPEITPFRELLTEFRSLTERYGQALLALGEARGEVAGLRSRVDMLEARVDLRLPSSAPPISSTWSSTPWPVPTERVVQRPATAADAARVDAPPAETAEAEPSPSHDDETGSHRRRGRAARRATERFADALARAEDPSPPELPGAEETAAALAALRQDLPPDVARAGETDIDADAEASLPRELPSAEQVLVADEDTTESEAAVLLEPAHAAEPSASEAEPARPAEPEDEPVVAAIEPASPDTTSTADVEVEREPEPRPVAAIAESVTEALEPDSQAAWDHERYSAAIEEPDWISADDAETVAVAGVPPAPEAHTDWSPPPGPESQSAWSPPEPEPASAWSPTDGEPTSGEAFNQAVEPAMQAPAGDEPAWDSPFAAPTRESSTAIPIESSGSRELDEGLAALEALANPQPSIAGVTDERAPAPERQAEPIGAPRPQAWVRPSPPPQLTTRSSASRAYRRLRRIFPT
jgi:hypothetical protein